MTNRPIFSRRPALPPRPERPAGLFLAAFIALVLFGILFPWFPGGLRLDEGRVVDRAIVAPRERTYASEALTEQERQARAAAVEPVHVLNVGIRDTQLGELDRILGAIRRIRQNPTLAQSARESEIRAVPGVDVSPSSAGTWARVSDDGFAAMGDEARNALSRVLTGTIREDGLEEARERAAALLSPLLGADLEAAIMEVVGPLLVPTLVVDEERTRLLRAEAMANTPPVLVTFERGQVVVEPGERLTAADVEALEQLGLRQSGVDPARVAAAALFAALGGVLTGGYVRAARPAALRGPRRLALFALLLLVPAVAAKFALPLIVPDLDRHFLAYAIPLAAAPMAAAVLLDVAAAVLLATMLAAIVAFISIYLPAAGPPGVAGQLETARLALTVLAGSLVGVYVTARADRLQRYLAAGIAVAATVAGVLFTLWLVDLDRRALDLPWIAGAAAVNGLLTALIAVGSFVLLSRPFGIITRLELMELAQLSHPLLRRLQDEAPGTFQHSMLVGNMAERAADRIGADALLVRVGAYYHDVGKLVAPGFFVENMPEGEDSPHEGLDPLQSTRVILQHVTGGIEIARREGLPEAVVRFIPEHHGTRLMTFFYRRAAEEDSEVSPELFRYPGPKPQTRETALVMIADSSEATVRASADRSGQRIREIIEGIIRERIDEGQFDECDLSLRDLRVAADTFAGALAAAYHPRVEYPQPTEREMAQRRMPALPAADGDAARGSEREEPAREPSDGRPASRPARRDEEIEPPSRRPAVPASPRPDQPELHEDTT